MYDNIGSKIKNLAKSCFIVETIIAIICSFVMIINGENTLLWGIVILVLGPVIAWVSSWVLYAFGDLVENVSKLKDKFVGETVEEKHLNNIDDVALDKTCEYCERKCSRTVHCKITTNTGVIYRHICSDCFEKLEATPTKKSFF